ncbi:CoA transferase subunit A [Streptomyces sp. NPDC001941]|uniref:CoA transferase subunit A n=1 Tax=Streptomyces sp. NPDC001941 TaxID=3154659 RepID=UPI003317376E
MDKVSPSASAALDGLADGASLAVGGFGLSGVPNTLIEAVLARGTRGLHVVSNNCGVDGGGLGILLAAGRIARVTGSYIGDNKEFARQYLAGELAVELVPQGTLAERLRAGGCGVPAFYTPAGVGTPAAEGKEVRSFDGRDHVLEHSLTTDFALVRAHRGDRHGNLVFRKSSRNFNPLAAMAGRIAVAEVEHLVEPGGLDPDEVHLPGVFVQRVVALTPGQAVTGIEKRTVRGR